MAKTILGVDIGSDSLKLALVSNGQVKKAVIVPIPNSLVKEYRVVSPETMGELIRDTMREHGMRCRNAAIVLPNETVYVRSVNMPKMTVDQLVYNLPFEFRDYITEELKDYYYDYAMISTPEEITREAPKPQEEGAESQEESEQANSMELLAAAAPVSLIEECRSMLRKAGLRLTKAAPTVCSYIALIRALEKRGGGKGEYCILDLGYQAIRMYMFNGDKHIVTRELEVGISRLIQLIAETASVDEHLAKVYLTENHDNWQNREECRSAYENIAIELMRALNFYRFSTPETKLNDIYLCGGGASIQPLCNTIAETVGMNIHRIDELVPSGDRVDNCAILAQAIGVTLEMGR